MSEDERKRRQEYKRNRKKWIIIQTIALALVAAFALTFFVVYDRMNRTYYIEYTEKGTVDYEVNLKDNNFFEEDSVGAGQSYVASLIDDIVADFKYDLQIDNDNVEFEYIYSVDAQLIIANKDTGDYIYKPIYNLIPETKSTVKDRDSLTFGASVPIDYHHYNQIATTFINTYDLKNTTSTLVVTMNVKVISTCNEFENSSNENVYFTALNIPLTEENFSMFTTSSNTENQSKVLACSNGVSQKIFLILTIVFASLAALEAIALVIFVFITKNEDVNYANKVRKIVSAYRSFIQQIEGQFDTEGYQIVPIKTFKEMLNIRDTIQSPILMFENLDQTVTEFLIPTSTKILYTFEIKVENYDEIYNTAEEEEIEEVEEVEEIEEPVILEEVDEEELEEVLATPDVDITQIDYDEDADEELEEGIEVVGVVWPEKTSHNKVYRYDPNGETLDKGDIVLVPTMDRGKNREVIRKAAIAHGNHRIDPASHPHVLKKITGVIRRHVESALTSTVKTEDTEKTVDTEKTADNE